jgi:protein ImuB
LRNPASELIDPERPFVLTVEITGGLHIAALNAAAERLGLMIGEPLADARAKAGWLQVRAADPAADDAALKRLALWATRYTPAVSLWAEENGADGFFLDITGAAHLFGGETQLLADLARRLNRFDLPARIAIADTAGAAWALSHYHSSRAIVLPPGQETEILVPLTIDALRLAPATRTTLRRLGFKRIGDLIDKPRAPFAARFETELLRRLDQAFGRASEPLAFLMPLPVYHRQRFLLEPIFTQEAVVAVATDLMNDLVPALERDGVGARTLCLSLYRVDGDVMTIDIGLTLPTRDASHVARLLNLKLERIIERIDAGFGFEALGLIVRTAERMTAQQKAFASVASERQTIERRAALIDALRQRLGPRSVRQLKPIASHLPERAEASCSAAAETIAWPAPNEARPRPLLLFPKAEPADVIALVPEGPPTRFRWRGAMHDVAKAQGPERIAGEWWRSPAHEPTRDYYLVEDKAGHRYWLYREGLYGRETTSPRWFMHGLFA